MLAPFRVSRHYGLLLLPLLFVSLTVSAQTERPDGSPSQATAVPAVPLTSAMDNEFEQCGMGRQEIREEMLRIRSEHEELEAEHDQLKMQCMNVKGQEHAQCQQKWRGLHEQQDALHERTKALHEKIEAMRQENRSSDNRSEHHAANNRDQPHPVPSSSEAAAGLQGTTP